VCVKRWIYIGPSLRRSRKQRRRHILIETIRPLHCHHHPLVVARTVRVVWVLQELFEERVMLLLILILPVWKEIYYYGICTMVMGMNGIQSRTLYTAAAVVVVVVVVQLLLLLLLLLHMLPSLQTVLYMNDCHRILVRFYSLFVVVRG
jgi:hypothetical protein